ncbi:MAG: cystathionine beta-synthase [Flavobacteriaceae bacterium]|nr:MAG: cystathionine beta-synthase [Flavobacteriaceae bacterium]
MRNTYNNILELIGNTPLVKLNKVTAGIKAPVFAKLEGQNPGHSAKDRIANYIIEQAEKSGALKPGGTIVETTSGNTGFSIAMIARVKGYKCILAISDKTQKEKIAYLTALGAKVYVCPNTVPAEHPLSYYEVGKRIQKETPNSIYLNQYFNTLNIEAHYLSTGPEIWEQTEGKVTHVVVCSGTGGTISGIGRYLKEKNPAIKVIGIDAYGSILKKYHETKTIDETEIYPNKIEGLGKNLVPGATDFSVIDKYVKVTDEEAAYAVHQLALDEGLFVGYTSGAAFQGFKQVLPELKLNDSHLVVLVFPDHGAKYITKMFSEKWMAENNFTDLPKTDAEIISASEVFSCQEKI